MQSEEEKKQMKERFDEFEKRYKEETFHIGESEYVYCFDKMSVSRVLQGYRLFRIDLELLKNLPKVPSDIQVAVERKTLQLAYTSILMKREGDGFAKFDPTGINDMDILDEITGEEYDRLLLCQQDFFSRSRLSSEVSKMKSVEAMTDASNAMKGLTPEQISVLIPQFGGGNIQLPPQMQSAVNTIMKETLEKLSQSRSVGV